MSVAKSIPKFSVQISKSMFVVIPSTIEVDLVRDISFSPQYDSPSSIATTSLQCWDTSMKDVRLITTNMVDLVDPTGWWSGMYQTSAKFGSLTSLN